MQSVTRTKEQRPLKVGLGDWSLEIPTAPPPPDPPLPPAASPLEVLVLLGPRAQVSLGRLGVRLETLSRQGDSVQGALL